MIKQNLNVECISNDPSIIEAKGEVNMLEGYFCNIHYIGSARDNHKRTPKKVKIGIRLYSDNAAST